MEERKLKKAKTLKVFKEAGLTAVLFLL
jgi:hypothetical protein